MDAVGTQTEAQTQTQVEALRMHIRNNPHESSDFNNETKIIWPIVVKVKTLFVLLHNIHLPSSLKISIKA